MTEKVTTHLDASQSLIGLLNVLVVEDMRPDREWITEVLRGMGVQMIECAETLSTGATALMSGRFNCALLDSELPPDGKKAGLQLLLQKEPVPVYKIMLTQYSAYMRDALLMGARRFLDKAVVHGDSDELRLALLDAGLFVRSGLETIMGSEKMLYMFRHVAAIARRDEHVTVLGESGSGKENVARALHGLSVRASGPWIPVNCACLDPQGAEAELFGVAERAYTGTAARPGLLEAAHKGHVFFDEIGELSTVVQAKLLRILENPGELRREGATSPVRIDDAPVDFRGVFATDKRLYAAVEAGHFSRPLYERIAKQIVEAHGGEIAVESRVGEGSTFMVKLPIEDATKDKSNG
jgi:DNA-binding NtrC family response regulator